MSEKPTVYHASNLISAEIVKQLKEEVIHYDKIKMAAKIGVDAMERGDMSFAMEPDTTFGVRVARGELECVVCTREHLDGYVRDYAARILEKVLEESNRPDQQEDENGNPYTFFQDCEGLARLALTRLRDESLPIT